MNLLRTMDNGRGRVVATIMETDQMGEVFYTKDNMATGQGSMDWTLSLGLQMGAKFNSFYRIGIWFVPKFTIRSITGKKLTLIKPCLLLKQKPIVIIV